MGRKDSKFHKRDHSILNEDTSVGSVYNITESVKEIKKLYEMSNCLDKDLTDVLLYYGQSGLSIDDIAIISNIPKKTMNDIFDKGREDYELGHRSVQSDYYRAYTIGLKMFEIETSRNASKRDPMKLLAVINPTKYSDKVTDKYELPTINICFGNKSTTVEESEEDVND